MTASFIILLHFVTVDVLKDADADDHLRGNRNASLCHFESTLLKFVPSCPSFVQVSLVSLAKSLINDFEEFGKLLIK